jgi:ubiquinone/menaquinone biosynthesis C-methylase UbiE
MVSYDNTHYNQGSTVENYDLCRHLPTRVLSRFAKTLIDLTERSCRGNEGNILEEGVGNGRILLPTIKESIKRGRKDKFYAIDKSSLMLEDLRGRMPIEETKRCQLDLGDIQKELPYEDRSLDCAYTFAVYHILNRPEEALDQVVRKLKDSGSFVFGKEFTQVFHGTEKRIDPGESEDFRTVNLIPCIQEFFHEYHRLRDQYGVPFEDLGVLYSDPSLVIDHLSSKGFDNSVVRGSELAYTKPHTFRQMLDAFRLRNITTFGSDIPDEIRLEMYADLLTWCKKEDFDLDHVLDVPASITLHVFSRK